MSSYRFKEARGMPLCQICNQREANLFITRTLNGQKMQISVCRQCAAESGIVKIDLNNLLAGLASLSQEQDKKETPQACPGCGMTLEEFNKTGRLGCSQCYSTFEEPMMHLLNRIHGHTQHSGKRPGQITNPAFSKEDELDQLRVELVDAISEEAYEHAAELRDRIHLLEHKGEVIT